VRRQDKQISDPQEIEEVLSNNKICRVAFSNQNIPYIVPMNYGYHENKLLLHSGQKGKKIEMIEQNNQVCFEISDSIEIIHSEEACHFGTKYRSVIGFGSIRVLRDFHRKKEALQIIMKQHTGKAEWQFTEDTISKAHILEIEIDSITGKKSGM
jgi:nitroimidazol reductase NimA-like FMN-containing flavoprotein (pyridoxamine 5'-phosphate oxidase superfamily)